MNIEEELKLYPSPVPEPAPHVQEALRDELAEIVYLMEAFMRMSYADDTGVLANRSAWLLRYVTLKLDAEIIHRFDVRMPPLNEDEYRVGALQHVVGKMEAHVHRALDVGGLYFALRSTWFLTYYVVNLAGRYCHDWFDVRLGELSFEEYDEISRLRDDGA